MNRTKVALTATVFAAALLISAGCSKDSSNPYGSSNNNNNPPAGTPPNTVVMTGSSFAPLTMTVARHTTITWRNDDGMTHTATSDNGLWNTGDITAGASKTVVLDSAGTFPYHCIYHSGMNGSITVQ
jgi:plastocyanin